MRTSATYALKCFHVQSDKGCFRSVAKSVDHSCFHIQENNAATEENVARGWISSDPAFDLITV